MTLCVLLQTIRRTRLGEIGANTDWKKENENQSDAKWVHKPRKFGHTQMKLGGSSTRAEHKVTGQIVQSNRFAILIGA